MLYLFLFWGFLVIGDIQATPLGNVDSHTYFPMPKYPKMMARTFVNGDFEVEIQVEGGAVKSIRVISAYVITRQKELTQSVPVFEQFFISNIENAVNNWRFSKEMENGIRKVKFSFRSVENYDKEMFPGYFIYKIEGVDEIMWEELPKRIVIEYHHPPLTMESVTQ
jgi:hypothetical protein